MHILVVHGYLLRGTGSNLYVYNLCKSIQAQGHQVSLFCQENRADKFSFIDRYLAYASDNQSVNREQHFSQGRGENDQDTLHGVSLYQPNLGGVLPVYVYDHYEGFDVKVFTEIPQEGLEGYIDKNTRALESFLRHQKVDLVISNHTIMQPVYTERALSRVFSGAEAARPVHIMVVHGSALNFSVRNSDLLYDYALEGIKKVYRIAFVSSHIQDTFLNYFKTKAGTDEKIDQKAVIIPAGVDTNSFKPVTRKEKAPNIERVVELLNDSTNFTSGEGKIKRDEREQALYLKELEQAVIEKNSGFVEIATEIRARYDLWSPDADAAEQLSDKIDWQNDPVILFFGKYLWTKGVQILIAAAPLVLQAYPHAKFIYAGFGSSRELFEFMVYCLDRGYRETFMRILANPEQYDPQVSDDVADYFAGLRRYLEDPDNWDEYFSAAEGRILSQSIFTGILNHEQLQYLIPCVKVSAAPSIFPEAFGLVGVEALASGVIPLLTYQSAFKDMIQLYAKAFKDITYRANKPLRRLDLDEKLTLNFAENLVALLQVYEGMSEYERNWVGMRAHKLAANNFSWDAVVRQFLAQAQNSSQG